MITKFESKKFNIKKLSFKKDEQKEDILIRSLHFSCEFIFIVEGKANLKCEEYSFDVKKGELLYFPKTRYHLLELPKGNDFECIVFRCNDEIFEKIPHDFNLHKPFHLTSNDDFLNFANDIVINYSSLNRDEFEEFIISSFPQLVQNSINKNIKNAYKLKYDESIRDVIQYFDKHLNKQIKLIDVSKSSNYSTSYLSAYFKQYLKISVLKLYEAKKMFYAKKFLDKGLLPIDICNKLGLETYTTFYRQFKHTLGQSPSYEFDINLDDVYEKRVN